MSTLTTTSPAEILKDNLEHTIFSWSKQSGLNPLNIERAKGIYLHDRSGKRYIDFSSQLMNVNIGHGHPKVAEAVAKQMAEVSYVHPGMITEARGKLGAKLAEITPGSLNRTFFTNGGTEAVEHAMKLARLYTGRHKIITLYQSYHGATYGALSAGGDPRGLPHDSQGVPNIIHVENPYFYRCPWNSKTPEECTENALAHLERVVKYEGPQYIAAIMLEGESGSSGCIKYPPGYWKGVKAIADRYGILTSCDEVMSGFGRTGKWFGIDNYGVEPDLMAVAKGLTCGYVPLGAAIASEKVAAYFDKNPLWCGLTYSSHPLGCAAAVASIKVYQEEKLIENAAAMGKVLEAGLKKLKEKHVCVGDVRGIGLFWLLELVKNRETKEPMNGWNKPVTEPMAKVAGKLKELGFSTFVRWDWVFCVPPLCINEEQINEGLAMVDEALSLADPYCH